MSNPSSYIKLEVSKNRKWEVNNLTLNQKFTTFELKYALAFTWIFLGILRPSETLEDLRENWENILEE